MRRTCTPSAEPSCSRIFDSVASAYVETTLSICLCAPRGSVSSKGFLIPYKGFSFPSHVLRVAFQLSLFSLDFALSQHTRAPKCVHTRGWRAAFREWSIPWRVVVPITCTTHAHKDNCCFSLSSCTLWTAGGILCKHVSDRGANDHSCDLCCPFILQDKGMKGTQRTHAFLAKHKH